MPYPYDLLHYLNDYIHNKQNKQQLEPNYNKKFQWRLLPCNYNKKFQWRQFMSLHYFFPWWQPKLLLSVVFQIEIRLSIFVLFKYQSTRTVLFTSPMLQTDQNLNFQRIFTSWLPRMCILYMFIFPFRCVIFWCCFVLMLQIGRRMCPSAL